MLQPDILRGASWRTRACSPAIAVRLSAFPTKRPSRQTCTTSMFSRSATASWSHLKAWDDLLKSGPRVSKDFMAERDQSGAEGDASIW